MNKQRISYKNLYKYDFINLYESVNGPSKPRYISYRNKNADFIKNDYEKFSKSQTKFNITKKNYKSFHKSLLHLKLSLNPKFKDNECICSTDRNSQKEKEIENFKQIYKKIFLTNTDDNTIQTPKIHNNKQIHLITDYRTKYKNNDDNKYMSIPSNTFLPFKKNKYLYVLPDIIKEKINDFIEETKMIRTAKLINTIKIDRFNKENSFMQIEFEENEIEMNSLKNNLKLLDIYKKCLGDYNKFLINEIKKENKLLNNYNDYKKNLEDQVNILQKKFNDIIKEIETVNNFKLIFTAIKNKQKMEDFSKQSKIYIEELKNKLKKQLIAKRKNLSISTRKKTTIYRPSKNKLKERKSTIVKFIINNQLSKINEKENIKEKTKDTKKLFRKTMSIITTPKETKKKIERFLSLQPTNIEKKKRFETIINNDNLDYDIERNEKLMVNNILKLINKYNIINSDIIDFKLQSSEEKISSELIKTNKLKDHQISDLNYAKAYNKSLTSKYKIISDQNNDYFLFLSIYRKINRIISSVITFRLKNFSYIIDKFKQLYDKNILYSTYKLVLNDSDSKKAYLEKEIINYIYNALSLIEQLQSQLLTEKNDFLNNKQFHDQILAYENKMDMIKRVNNNREKRNKELLRKQQIYNKAIEKSNKIIFRTFRKVENHFPIHKKIKLNINNENDENEELLLY